MGSFCPAPVLTSVLSRKSMSPGPGAVMAAGAARAPPLQLAGTGGLPTTLPTHHADMELEAQKLWGGGQCKRTMKIREQ